MSRSNPPAAVAHRRLLGPVQHRQGQSPCVCCHIGAESRAGRIASADSHPQVAGPRVPQLRCHFPCGKGWPGKAMPVERTQCAGTTYQRRNGVLSDSCKVLALLVVMLAGVVAASAADEPATASPNQATPESGCLSCHQGIESIRETGSKMLRQILDEGASRGDGAGCVVCNGGDPAATEKQAAHGGEAFYPDPGSPWINQHTCGQCHPDHVRVQWHSLMMTEAGKIHGVTWTFGALTGYEHRWANYNLVNPSLASQRLGTTEYRQYMAELKKREPQVFVDRQEALPPAPTNLEQLGEHPELAAFTYLRNQCLRCHHAVKGRQVRGDYRGMGCSSCHIPYGNEGLYEGDDPTIARDEPGHMLVHSIQGTREAKVIVHGHQYSGIPVETCTTCHDRGKRIGVSFQGLMEIPYESPFTAEGDRQPALHTKHYLAMHQDVHYQKGMLCQDCHTSIDVHGDGFIAAANLGAVEVECTDCHGTPTAYPWELPLGYGDEFAESPAAGPPRGTADDVLRHTRQGTVLPTKEGYLLTARGNPMPDVIRMGNLVVVHTAAGKNLVLKPLKTLMAEGHLDLEGRVAMGNVGLHIDNLECYACHAAWAPQCYGCHVRIDYSQGKKCFDWLAAGHRHKQPDCAADRGELAYDTTIPGRVEEQRSFTRWEDPALGVNGEGRVSPVAPGCQPSITVIGPEGKPIVVNRIFRTPPNSEGAGSEGQLAIDMSPTQPHTMAHEARSCPSCHLSDKALGYGIGSGNLTRAPSDDMYVDLETADGRVLPKSARVQTAGIAGLGADWSRFVTEDGRQLQTVGHHFRLSRPLSNEERTHIDRQGVCLACHQEIPTASLAVSFLHHVAEATDQLPHQTGQHNSLVHKILLVTAWGQLTAAVLVPLGGVGLVCGLGIWWFRRRKRARRQRSEAAAI